MSKDLVVIADQPRIVEMASGGGLEGASRIGREVALWSPSMGSPDQIVVRAKPLADARARDMSNNDGYIRGAVSIHKDSIVGGRYRLNAAPVIKVLQTVSKGFDAKWAEEFQVTVEAYFDLIAESPECYLDAAGTNTFTDMIRLGVGGTMLGGEILASAEWLSKDRTRPLSTAIQMLALNRLSNPDGMPDEPPRLKGGVVKDFYGKPISYWVRQAHPGEFMDPGQYTWKNIPARKPWGRKQIIHIFEQQEAGQTRGIAEIVSVLKNMRMTKNLDELLIQRAVIDASYTSAIESELPPDVVYGMMGAGNGPENFTTALGTYMELLATYFGAAGNVAIDGVRTPVLPPGTKMTSNSLGDRAGADPEFGERLLRHSAAGLGLSGEEFMNNFTKTSYSGLRGAFNQTDKRMRAKKKIGADRFAGSIYTLMLEEMIDRGMVPLPGGVDREVFYLPLMKEALCNANWIGSGAGQIDELKETQAAILRIKSGLSTYEIECAKLGSDFREIFTQRAREEGIISGLELEFDTSGAKADKGTGSQDNNPSKQGKKAAK